MESFEKQAAMATTKRDKIKFRQPATARCRQSIGPSIHHEATCRRGHMHDARQESVESSHRCNGIALAITEKKNTSRTKSNPIFLLLSLLYGNLYFIHFGDSYPYLRTSEFIYPSLQSFGN